MSSPAFATRTLTIAAGVSTPIMPAFGRTVTIRNGGTTDLLVYSTDGDDSTLFAIAAGWQETITVSSFQLGLVVFYLKCSLDCPVTLRWA